MQTGQADSTVGALLDTLVARAVADDVRSDVAREVAAVTLRGLGLQTWRIASSRDARRAEAYFWAVVRRRTVRGTAGPRAVARLVAAAVVEDLKQTGRDGQAVFEQLRRGWSEQLPDELIEEYRVRLCG